MYETLADVVHWLHLFFFLFVIVGGTISKGSLRFQKCLATLLVVTIVSWALFLDCPLTILEDELRRMHDPSHVRSGPAISRFVDRFFGFTVPSQSITVVIIGLTLYVLYKLWRD